MGQFNKQKRRVPFACGVLARLICAVLVLAGGSLAAQAQQSASPPAAQPAITVTLLGTGTPQPDPERFSASTLVEAGGMRFLFDAGRGVTIRLSQLKVPIGSIEATFLTHFHSDHVVGLPDLWLTGLLSLVGMRKGPMIVIGPVGTNNLTEHLEKAFQEDARIRIAEQRMDPALARISPIEFNKDEGVVFEKAGVKVTAFLVEHGDVARPAYGYRLDYAGHSVLLSGDTTYNANIIKYGTGTDLLIHEVAEAPQSMKDSPMIKSILKIHTSPEECGRIFTLTQPKMAAYTHLVLLRSPNDPPVTPAVVEANTRKTYSGPLVIGEDLTRFEIGDELRTLRWNAQKASFAPLDK